MADIQQIHGCLMRQLPIMAVMRMRHTLLMPTTITWHNMEVYYDYHNNMDIVRGTFSPLFVIFTKKKNNKKNFSVSQIDCITINKVLLMLLKRVPLHTPVIQVWPVSFLYQFINFFFLRNDKHS